MANSVKTNKALKLTFGILWRVLIVAVIVAAFYFVISVGFDFGHDLFAGEAAAEGKGKKVTFVVKEGESTQNVIDHLQESGLINNKLKFRVQIIFYQRKILPGEYKFKTSMTSKEILGYLNKGPSSLEE